MITGQTTHRWKAISGMYGLNASKSTPAEGQEKIDARVIPWRRGFEQVHAEKKIGKEAPKPVQNWSYHTSPDTYCQILVIY